VKETREFSAYSTRLPEAEALRLARKGVPAGFESLYQLHGRRVFRMCLRSASSPAEAEKLTQKMFLELFRNIRKFRAPSQLTGWLYRMTAEIALRELRKKPYVAASRKESAIAKAGSESPSLALFAADTNTST